MTRQQLALSHDASSLSDSASLLAEFVTSSSVLTPLPSLLVPLPAFTWYSRTLGVKMCFTLPSQVMLRMAALAFLPVLGNLVLLR